MDRTKIEWTDRTWNPLTGCTKVSPGCDHCYAKTMHERFHGAGSFDTVELHPDRLEQPLRWRAPARVFVNSMSDLFHQDVPDDFIAEVWAVMSLAPQHTFQILTKRHARMRALTSSFLFRIMVNAHRMRRGYSVLPDSPPLGPSWPLANVWLGVSVEDQHWADLRIPALLNTPATVRFISAEPLLGPIDLDPFVCSAATGGFCSGRHNEDPLLDWVIVGGESGRGARPMNPDWARSLRDQCDVAGVAFLFKQWGAWAPADRPLPYRTSWGYLRPDATWTAPGNGGTAMGRVGKKAAGRELDGRLHDEYPAAVTHA